MENSEVGWLAGIIDGEGCLCLRILLRKTRAHGVRPRFQPQLTVVNTDEEIIRRASRVLASLGVKHRVFERNKKHGKKQFCIDVYSSGLRLLLPQISGLLCKNREAEILMRALQMGEENRTAKHAGSWGSQPIPNERLVEYDSLRSQLVGLHGRQAKSLIKHSAVTFKAD